MKLEDLTGWKFGKLTVERYAGNQKWECLCECGNRSIVLAESLKKGRTKSCGCLKMKNLVGKKFGRLTVLKYAGNQKWECLCDCGNRSIVLAENLKKGHTKSCGCLKEKNLVGKKLGRLTVVSVAEKDERNIKLYNCKCDCGNECVIRSDILLRGAANSCGCTREENRIKAVKEKVFVDGTMPALIALDKEPTKANKSGVVGVNWDKSRNKWQASIRFKGHKYNLGRFENFDDAVDARKKAEKEIFGNFLLWYESYKQKK